MGSVIVCVVPLEANRSGRYSTPSKVAAEVLPELIAYTNTSWSVRPPELLLELELLLLELEEELLDEELLELDELEEVVVFSPLHPTRDARAIAANTDFNGGAFNLTSSLVGNMCNSPYYI